MKTPLAVTQCTCGGWLTAYGLHGQALAAAVRRHQATARHREWRELGGLLFDPEKLGRVVQ